jgi:hypothetical protein
VDPPRQGAAICDSGTHRLENTKARKRGLCRAFDDCGAVRSEPLEGGARAAQLNAPVSTRRTRRGRGAWRWRQQSTVRMVDVEAIADRDWNKAFSVMAPVVTPRADPHARPRRRWRHADVAHVDGQADAGMSADEAAQLNRMLHIAPATGVLPDERGAVLRLPAEQTAGFEAFFGIAQDAAAAKQFGCKGFVANDARFAWTLLRHRQSATMRRGDVPGFFGPVTTGEGRSSRLSLPGCSICRALRTTRWARTRRRSIR